MKKNISIKKYQWQNNNIKSIAKTSMRNVGNPKVKIMRNKHARHQSESMAAGATITAQPKQRLAIASEMAAASWRLAKAASSALLRWQQSAYQA